MKNTPPLEELIKSKQQNVKLFLCGINHFNTFLMAAGRYVSFQLADAIKAITPDIVLLEGKTPESTYFEGTATGNFTKELKGRKINADKLFAHQSPCLEEIRESADAAGCLVKGLDMPDDRITQLANKCRIHYRRIRTVYEALYKNSKMLLDDKPHTLSDSEYHQMEALYDWLYSYDYPRTIAASNGINEFMGEIENLLSIFNRFPKLRKFFGDAAKDISGICASSEKYAKKRDAEIFKNMMVEYDGVKRILVYIGAGHLQENSALMKSIERKNVRYSKVINYKI